MKYVHAWIRARVAGRSRAVGFSKLRFARDGKMRRKLLVVFIVLVAIVALLPTIIAKTPLGTALIAKAVPPGVRLSVGDMSLGWVSPPTLSNIQLTDADGGKLLEVETVRCNRSLWALATDLRNLGQIEVVRPVAHVSLRADGSNIEDVLAKLSSEPASSDSNNSAASGKQSVPAVTLKVVEGAVFTEDAVTGRRWRLQDVNAQIESLGAGGLGQLSLGGRLEEGEAAAAQNELGRFLIALAPIEGAEAGKRQVTIQMNTVPLAAVVPLLRRNVTGADISGTVSGQGSATWSDAAMMASGLPGDLQTAGQFWIDRLDATASVLAGDHVRLLRVELPWQVHSIVNPQGERALYIEKLQLVSEPAQLALRGAIDAAGVRPDIEARGVLQVAQLAAMLPHALRVREGTTLTGGTVELSVHEQPAAGGQQLSGSLRALQLAATNGGRPLRWDAPVSANFALRRTAAGVIVDSLQCTSDFLSADATGDANHVTASARFDLNRLAGQLGQFIDLSGIDLAGSGTAQAEWQLVGGNKFTATASGDLAQLRVGLGNGGVWAEPQLALRTAANGTLDPATRRLTRVDEAWLKVAAQGDQLDAQLVRPVEVPAAPASATSPIATWPLTLRATGGVGRWLTRARPWVDIGTWQFDGQSELTANVSVAGTSASATETKLSITDLRAANSDWSINEQRVALTGDGRWDGATGLIAADNLQLITSTVSLAVKDLRLGKTATGEQQFAGGAAFRADVLRLAAMRVLADRNSPKAPPRFVPSGTLTGNLRFTNQSGRAVSELLLTGENLSLAQLQPGDVRSLGMPAVWQEPKMTLRATTSYDQAADRLAVDNAQLESSTVAAVITGSVDKLSTAAETNLSGTANYDLDKLTPLLRPLVGNGVQLNGREQAKFAVAGRLNESHELMAYVSQTTPAPQSAAWSRRLQARLELPWSGANVYGLPVSGGRLAATLSDGIVKVEPLALSVSDGRLTATPVLKLDPAPMELALPAGPLLSDVKISPEVSETMLKYIAPVLAGATESEGHFSLKLDDTRVPILDAKKASVAGQLTVHSVKVVPGPMAKEWIGLVQQIEGLVKQGNPLAPPVDGIAPAPPQRQITLLSIRDQPVNFRVVDGRVHHERMDFLVDDVQFSSTGSVGFDETIQLMLTVPIQDRWIEKQRLLAGLKGQSLQVPVTGTLARPQLDKNALASLSGQIIQGAAGQAVGNEINRALDKLFKPRQ